MTNSLLDTQLDLIEQQFNELRSTMLDGNPQQVQVASGALQQLAVDLLQMVDEVGRSSLQEGFRMRAHGRTNGCIPPIFRISVFAFLPAAGQSIGYAAGRCGIPLHPVLRQSL